jgi:hypothetical protein
MEQLLTIMPTLLAAAALLIIFAGMAWIRGRQRKVLAEVRAMSDNQLRELPLADLARKRLKIGSLRGRQPKKTSASKSSSPASRPPPEELDRLPRESVVACLAGERAADRSFPARHPWRVRGRLVQPGAHGLIDSHWVFQLLLAIHLPYELTVLWEPACEPARSSILPADRKWPLEVNARVC